MAEYCEAEKALINIWESLFAHRVHCSLYESGLRLNDSDDCNCNFEWDSGTIEWVAAEIEDSLPNTYEHN